MTFARLYRRIGAWLAMVALLAGSLSPVVTQAMVAGADHAGWLEVCSASGVVWIKAGSGHDSDGQPDEGSPPVSDAVQSCPWCTVHGGGFGLLPADWPAHMLPARLTDLPSAFCLAPPLPAVWAPAHSRAPPLVA